jgi:hypothetical protein
MDSLISHSSNSSLAVHENESPSLSSMGVYGDNQDLSTSAAATNAAPLSSSILRRSTPIAIYPRRSRSGSGDRPQSRTDDDDSSDYQSEAEEKESSESGLHYGRKNAASGDMSQSLPSVRLLQAPLLASCSVPTPIEDECTYYSTMLPPPMALSESLPGSVARSRSVMPSGLTGSSWMTARGAAIPTSYGSLRESHIRGQFLDGPRSFRDRRTGQLCTGRPPLRVRFEEDRAWASPEVLSIGERIQQQQNQYQHQHQQSSASASQTDFSASKQSEDKGEQGQTDANAHVHAHASSLSALMENAQIDDDIVPEKNGYKHSGIAEPSISFYDEQEDAFSKLPDNVLSTSLTGLELLQRGIKMYDDDQNTMPTSSDTSEVNNNSNNISSTPVWSDESVPRDAQGNNSLLSRSFSDPTPRSIRNLRSSYGNMPAMRSPNIGPRMSSPLFAQTRQMSGVALFPAQPALASEAPSAGPSSFLMSAVQANAQQQQHVGNIQSMAAAYQPYGMYPATFALGTAIGQEDGAPEAVSMAVAENVNPDTEGAFDMDLE